MSRSKYHAKKTPCNQGHVHDSKKEAKRCDELYKLARLDVIRDIRTQVKIDLFPSFRYAEKDSRMKNERGLSYIADFQYVEVATGKLITEDVKGVKTPEYVIKRKLVKWAFCREGNCVFIET